MSGQQARRTFKAGEIILKQGEPGDCAYIIEEGQVEIAIARSDGKSQVISTRGAGAIIGEMAIVDAAPRAATVRVPIPASGICRATPPSPTAVTHSTTPVTAS